MRTATFAIVLSVGVLAAAFGVHAQQPAPAPAAPRAAAAPAPKPVTLFLRETFQGTAVTPAVPLTNAQLLNPNLEVRLYGPGAMAKPDHPSGLQLYNELDPVTGMDVSYIWSGLTEANWMFTLRDKNNDVDLSGLGRIHWRARTRGFNTIRPVIKLADGTMLVGDFGQGESTYWHENEFFVGDVPRWRVFDEKEIIATKEGEWRTKVDLTKVSEIGVTDLSRGSGGGRGGNSGLDWIEVYGNPVKRGS